MNSSTFKSLTRLLEKWQVDPQKTGRDFGEYIRHHIGKSFSGSQSQIDFNSWDEISVRLTRIASNHYKAAYPVNKSVSSTGLTAEEASQAISNEFIELLQEEDKKGIFQKLRFKIRSSD